MNDDNKTRILRPQTPVGRPDGDDKTRNLKATAAHSGHGVDDEDEPSTRVVSSRGPKRSEEASDDGGYELVAGWLVVIEGPGRGCTCEIFFGMNSIGRGSGERISLDFGDTAISREAHAYLVFDEKQSDFYLQHGGKSNLVRLNGAPVLAPQPLKNGDTIEIGDTKLRFVPLCGDDFTWEAADH
jgi:hypothetical protein